MYYAMFGDSSQEGASGAESSPFSTFKQKGFKALVKKQNFTDEVLITTKAEMKSLVNNRLLTKVS